MSAFMRSVTAVALASSLCSVSTAAVAAPATQSAVTSAAPVAAAPSNPWLTLSAISNNSAAASAALTARDDSGPGFPPIAPLAVILATIAVGVYILVKDDGGSHRSDLVGGLLSLAGVSVSPA
jgi:hypothetical protein